MSDRREGKIEKKDSNARREITTEINEEANRGHVETKYQNPNRDQSRGDWDRTGEHSDEGMSRADEE